MQALSDWLQVAQLIASITVVLSFPALIARYVRTTRKEARDRELGTYNALDDKYIEYLRICLQHPRLDIFDIPLQAPQSLSAEEKEQELIAFTILMSIFERAFLMYQQQNTAIKMRQWVGWQEYIVNYCARKNFKDAWIISGNTFDTSFQIFMQDILRKQQQ